MAKNKPNIDEQIQQALREYKEAHKPKVETKYGNTYITVFGEEHYNILRALLKLMRVQYSVGLTHYYDNDGQIVLNISGEDEVRANYIRKFIENGFRLTWE